MKIKSLKTFLRPYVMLDKRRTTINNAFAAAVAPSDIYDEETVSDAMRCLGLDPRADLLCVYCGNPAKTFDHVFALVKNNQFSGHGHRLGNLLPCCKPCNSAKGNKSWQSYLASLSISDSEKARRYTTISEYLLKFAVEDRLPERSPDHDRLDDIRRQVLALLEEGDQIAAKIRAAAITSPS